MSIEDVEGQGFGDEEEPFGEMQDDEPQDESFDLAFDDEAPSLNEGYASDRASDPEEVEGTRPTVDLGVEMCNVFGASEEEDIFHNAELQEPATPTRAEVARVTGAPADAARTTQPATADDARATRAPGAPVTTARTTPMDTEFMEAGMNQMAEPVPVEVTGRRPTVDLSGDRCRVIFTPINSSAARICGRYGTGPGVCQRSVPQPHVQLRSSSMTRGETGTYDALVGVRPGAPPDGLVGTPKTALGGNRNG
jgi:hypothetical protein